MGIMSVLGGNHVVCLGGNSLIQSGVSPQCGTQYQIDGWNMGYLHNSLLKQALDKYRGGGTKAAFINFFIRHVVYFTLSYIILDWGHHSCGNPCQIWMWYSIGKLCYDVS